MGAWPAWGEVPGFCFGIVAELVLGLNADTESTEGAEGTEGSWWEEVGLVFPFLAPVGAERSWVGVCGWRRYDRLVGEGFACRLCAALSDWRVRWSVR